MEFGYNYEKVGGSVLELEDAFNTNVKLTTYNEEEYYLITRTKHGYTSMLTVGPLPIEGEYLGKYSSINYKKFPSESKKIKMEIDKFINDNKKLTQIVEEVEPEEVYSSCIKWNLLDYMNRSER